MPEKLLEEFPRLAWLPQKIGFYDERFLDSLPWPELLLRNIFPRIKLGLSKEKRANKTLANYLSTRLAFAGNSRYIFQTQSISAIYSIINDLPGK